MSVLPLDAGSFRGSWTYTLTPTSGSASAGIGTQTASWMLAAPTIGPQ